jgi:hypothetical protein
MPMHLAPVEEEQPLRDILAFGFRAFEPGIKLHQFGTADTALPYSVANGRSIDLFVLDLLCLPKWSSAKV